MNNGNFKIFNFLLKTIIIVLCQSFVFLNFGILQLEDDLDREFVNKVQRRCLSPSITISDINFFDNLSLRYRMLSQKYAFYIRIVFHDLAGPLTVLLAKSTMGKDFPGKNELKIKIESLIKCFNNLHEYVLENNCNAGKILGDYELLLKNSQDLRKDIDSLSKQLSENRDNEVTMDDKNKNIVSNLKKMIELITEQLNSYFCFLKGDIFEINGPVKGKYIANLGYFKLKDGVQHLSADLLEDGSLVNTKVTIEEDSDFEAYLNPYLFAAVKDNLVKNALEAMNRSRISEREIKLQFLRQGENIIIKFSNKGKIDVEFLEKENGVEKIFLPANTTKGDKVRHGLGLAGALDIVRAHGGTITAENKDGNAVFTIKFNRIELLWRKVEYEEKCGILPLQEKINQWNEHPPENFDAWIKWLADNQHGNTLERISKYGDAEIMKIKPILNLGLPVYNMLCGLISEGKIEGKITDIISYKLCFELNKLEELNVSMLSLMKPHIQKFKDISRGFYVRIGENLEEIGKSLEGMESLPDEEIIVKAELIGEHADSITKKINELSKDKKMDELFRLTMQHEVNNTLPGIVGPAGLLKLFPEKKEKYIPKMKQSLKRIHLTLNRLNKMENFRIHPEGHHIEIYARQLNNFIMEEGAFKESEEKVRLGVLPDGTDMVYIEEGGASIMVVEEGREVLFKIEKNSDSTVYTAKGLNKDGKTVLACANIPLKDEEFYKKQMLDKLTEMGVSDIVVPSALYKELESRKSAALFVRKEDIVIHSETDTEKEEIKINWVDAVFIDLYQKQIIEVLSNNLQPYKKDDNLVLLNKIKIDIDEEGIKWAVSEGRLLLKNKEGNKLLIYFAQEVLPSITMGEKVYGVGENTLNDLDTTAKVFGFNRTEDGLLVVRLAEITDNSSLNIFFEKKDSSQRILTRDLPSETQNFIAQAI